MNRFLLVLFPCLASCATPAMRTAEPAAEPTAPAAEATATETPDAPPSAIPFAWLVPSSIEVYLDMPLVFELGDGGYLLDTRESLVTTDRDLRPTRRTETEPTLPAPIAVDPQGRYAVTRVGVVDLVERRRAPLARGRAWIGADRDAVRCVAIEADETTGALTLVVEGCVDRDERARITTSRAELTAATDRRSSRGRGGGSSPTSGFGLFDESTAGLDGDRLVVAIGDGVGRLCSYDLTTGARLGCVATSGLEIIDEVALATDRVCTTTDLERRCRSITSLAAIPAPDVPGSNLALSREPDGTQRVVDVSTGRVVKGAIDASAEVVIGRTRAAIVVGTSVEFVEANGATSTATLTPAPPTDDPELRRRFRFVGDRLLGFDRSIGLARIEAGDRDRGLDALPAFEALVVIPSAETLDVWSAGSVVRIGPAGIEFIDADDVTDDVRRSSGLPRSFEVLSRIAPDVDPGLLGAVPTVDGLDVAVAYVTERGSVHVLDERGADAVPEIRLPRDVARSGCDSLMFLTDVDLALHGPRPCIPTRIRFREGRTEPLGLAYVFANRTPDGSRTALLANRKVTILDARTGATIVDFDPQTPHARVVLLASNGLMGLVFGESNRSVFDLRPEAPDASTPSSPVRIRPIDDEAHLAMNGLLLRCEGDALSLSNAYTTTPWRSVPSIVCDWYEASRGDIGLASTALDATIHTRRRATVVRARDGATLDLAFERTPDGIAVVLVEDGAVVGVFPEDAPSPIARDPSSGRIVPLPRRGDLVLQRVRDFFTVR